MRTYKNHCNTSTGTQDNLFFKPDRDRSSSVRRSSKRLNYRESDLDTRLLSYEKIKRQELRPTRLNSRQLAIATRAKNLQRLKDPLRRPVTSKVRHSE